MTHKSTWCDCPGVALGLGGFTTHCFGYYDGPLRGWLICRACATAAAFAIVDWDHDLWQRLLVAWRWEGRTELPTPPPAVDCIGITEQDFVRGMHAGCARERLFAVVCDPYFTRVTAVVDVAEAAPADWHWPASVHALRGSGLLGGN